ncbi:MAG TPA: prepilin-type N-terminal cleavage/methylation domain-containing protein, partial [Candidatus Limnocylindrales bacterium]|nr:prepilin-type N-terminal cleavage/methylation domain-containing protein [Candidatus Limnocylindrales bacterium]
TDSRRRAASGFTLVELLIVVIILGVLAAVVIPQFASVSAEAKESSVRSNLATVRQAISLYRVQHNETYPGQAGWSQFVTQLTSGTLSDGSPGTKYGPYLRDEFPDNAFTGTSTGKTVVTMPAGPSGTEAWIYCTTDGQLRANQAGNAPSGTAYFDL